MCLGTLFTESFTFTFTEEWRPRTGFTTHATDTDTERCKTSSSSNGWVERPFSRFNTWDSMRDSLHAAVFFGRCNGSKGRTCPELAQETLGCAVHEYTCCVWRCNSLTACVLATSTGHAEELISKGGVILLAPCAVAQNRVGLVDFLSGPHDEHTAVPSHQFFITRQ